MQDYKDFAAKNGVTLLNEGKCQFCGGDYQGGIKECVDAFNNGLESLINFYDPKNMIYKFLSVDTHTLQHPEIHGRWNNHLHLTRLHLILKHKMNWTYESTSKLSQCLNQYKKTYPDEYLNSPKPLERGISIKEVIEVSTSEQKGKEMIKKWAIDVYTHWEKEHEIVDEIAQNYLLSTH